jgi:ABC-type multidrug transport system fused ATPase/permease subunit
MMKKKMKKGRIDFKYNLKLYFSHLKRYKTLVFVVLFFTLIAESVTILEKFLFKIVVDNGTQFTEQKLPADQFIRIMLIVAGVYAAASLTRAAAKWIYHTGINKIEGGVIADIKRKFFDYLINLDYSFHTKHKTGGMISKLARIGGAVERLSDVFIFNLAPLTFQLIATAVSSIYFGWTPLVIMLLTITVFVAYSVFLLKLQENKNIEANNAEDTEKANMADMFTNIESIKYFGKENLVKSKFRSLTEITKEKTIAFWRYYTKLDFTQSIILSVGTFLLIYFTIKAFMRGDYTIGTLVFIYTIFTSLMGNMFNFVFGIRNFYRAMADFEMLFFYAKLKNKIKDKKNAEELKIREGEIIFNNISFNYGKRKIFHNFNLVIPKNKKVALVGHSGCGKTTLVKLLYRLYDVDSGAVLIDGKNIKDLKQESLRSEMSVVPQECILFDDTVYNNVAFSKPGATREEVIRAIRFAQLDNIIKIFPNKERTIVGERGVRLSGGEKQRVSIARAILANKRVLVLDEATSSLDSQTEHEIQSDLEELMKGRTSIIIAHRLSTIMKADKIIVMKKGKIVQEGTHERLIRQPGEYKHLWGLQRGGYIK